MLFAWKIVRKDVQADTREPNLCANHDTTPLPKGQLVVVPLMLRSEPCLVDGRVVSERHVCDVQDVFRLRAKEHSCFIVGVRNGRHRGIAGPCEVAANATEKRKARPWCR